jgi:hypothetical protein
VQTKKDDVAGQKNRWRRGVLARPPRSTMGLEEGDVARKKDDVARTERWVEKRSGGQQGTC